MYLIYICISDVYRGDCNVSYDYLTVLHLFLSSSAVKHGSL